MYTLFTLLYKLFIYFIEDFIISLYIDTCALYKFKIENVLVRYICVILVRYKFLNNYYYYCYSQ